MKEDSYLPVFASTEPIIMPASPGEHLPFRYLFASLRSLASLSVSSTGTAPRGACRLKGSRTERNRFTPPSRPYPYFRVAWLDLASPKIQGQRPLRELADARPPARRGRRYQSAGAVVPIRTPLSFTSTTISPYLEKTAGEERIVNEMRFDPPTRPRGSVPDT